MTSISKEDFHDKLRGKFNLSVLNNWIKIANIISMRENIGLIFDKEFGEAIYVTYYFYREEVPDPDKSLWDDNQLTNIVKAWAIVSGKIGIEYTPSLNKDGEDDNVGKCWQSTFNFYKSKKKTGSHRELAKLVYKYTENQLED